MSQHLTICYVTSRKDPKIEWFFSSLNKQLNLVGGEVPKIVLVDFFCTERYYKFESIFDICHTPPKPSIWQGKHRLTKENWFDAGNARNTGLCLAPDGYIAYVDDLSVLMPGWLTNVRQAMSFNGITLGAYRKVKNLVVENGLVTSYDQEWTGGRDSRWFFGNDSGSVPCHGDMLYGCSLVAPVEALLTVNGWPEALCGGLGFEDVAMGQVLENAGFKFHYNRNMLTFESEEHHGLEPAFRRDCFEKHPNDPTDKGHSVLNMVKGGMKEFPSHYEGGIRKLRQDVLSGKPFPILQHPMHEWHTGKLLSEL